MEPDTFQGEASRMELCDHTYVPDLRQYGEVIASGTPTEAREDQIVMEAYFGT